MKSALVFGYYGYDNLGDELLCRATIDILKKAFFREIYLLVPKGRKEDYRWGNVIPVNRFDPISVMNAVLHSEIVVCGGGGIFQDQTSLRSFLYYSSLVILARIFGKPVFLLANSLGPVKRKFSRMILRYLLSRKKVFLIARDAVSERYARRFSKNVFGGTDLAVLELEKMQIESQKERRVSFCLREPLELSEIITCLKEMGFEKFTFAPLSPQDREVAMKLLEKYGNFELSDDSIKSIASSSLVISQRMHGCLISAYFGIPFVAVNNSKATRFMRKYLSDYPGYTDENPADIALAVAKVMKKPVEVRERFLQDARTMEQNFLKLLKNIDL
ncbi:MAG: polysaccharide pyruvyl transferase family protein [Pseudothermotoga sp.]